MQRNVPIVLSVLVASASAAAQDAVQWSTSSGGNGHWFAVISVPAPHTWQRARQLAAGRGADLASIASHTENEFVKALVRRPEVWNASVGPWNSSWTKWWSSTCTSGTVAGCRNVA